MKFKNQESAQSETMSNIQFLTNCIAANCD